MSLDNPFLLGVSMHLQGNDDGAGFGVKGTSLNNTGVLGTSNNGAGVFGSSIGARWLKPLHHFTRLSAFLTIALVVAGTKAQANNGFAPGERIGAVSRITDTLDVFAADLWGAMYWAGWGKMKQATLIPFGTVGTTLQTLRPRHYFQARLKVP